MTQFILSFYFSTFPLLPIVYSFNYVLKVTLACIFLLHYVKRFLSEEMFYFIVVMGSMEHSLASLSVYGSIETDGESYQKSPRILDNVAVNGSRGTGGGSGGSILLFLQTVLLDSNSIISSIGGYGFPNGGGGGGGGRIHFDWSYISTGDEYLPIANVKGNISIRLVSIFLIFAHYHNILSNSVITFFCNLDCREYNLKVGMHFRFFEAMINRLKYNLLCFIPLLLYNLIPLKF